jgi:hypothetical protein
VLRTQDRAPPGRISRPLSGPEAGEVDKAAVGIFLDAEVVRVVYYPASLTPADCRHSVGYGRRGNILDGHAHLADFLGSTDFPPLLRFVDADNGWLLAQQGAAGMHRYPVYLLRTGDGGRTWDTAIDPFEGAGLQSCNKTGLFFLDSQTGWVTVDNCPVTAPELSRSPPTAS